MTSSALDRESIDPLCLGPTAQGALLGAAPWRRFGVVGDSLSLGTGSASPGYRDLGWSDRVAEALRDRRPRTAYLNTAAVGATTPQVLRTQLSAMESFAPDLLHVPSGANDILRGRPDFDLVERDLRQLWDRAARTGALLQAFTLGRAFVVPAFADWGDRIRRVNDLTRRIAAEHDAVVVDMWDHPVNQRADLVGSDGIHFSTMGQAVLATEVIRALLTRTGTTSTSKV